MKNFAAKISTVYLLNFVEIFNVVSSFQKQLDIIDNFIDLAESKSNEIAKRNSIVDGGVFVPYKSTTIVHKSRIVPVTFGFVIKKETLKQNPALYKLGVKMMDEKVESTSKEILHATKAGSSSKEVNKPKSVVKPELEAKSNCRLTESKILGLLAKLGKDVNRVEKAILAQKQTVQSEEKELIGESLKKKENPQPQVEAHVSGAEGMFARKFNEHGKSQKHDLSKNLFKYWQCRRSRTKKECSVLFLVKHIRPHQDKNLRTKEKRYGKHSRKHGVKHEGDTKRHRKGHDSLEKEQKGTHNSQNKKQRLGKLKRRHEASHEDENEKHRKRHNNNQDKKKHTVARRINMTWRPRNVAKIIKKTKRVDGRDRHRQKHTESRT